MLTGCGYEINITIKPKDKEETKVTKKRQTVLPIEGSNEIIIGYQPDDTSGSSYNIGYYPVIKRRRLADTVIGWKK